MKLSDHLFFLFAGAIVWQIVYDLNWKSVCILI